MRQRERASRLARSIADFALLAVASAICLAAALAVQMGADTATRAVEALLYTAVLILLLALMRRLELALYALVPLMTAVRIEPAPVDFMVVGLVGALALRGELARFLPPRSVTSALAVILFTYAAGLLIATDPVRAVKYTTATLLVVATGYVGFQLAARQPRTVERAYLLAALLLGVETIFALVLPSPASGPANVFSLEGFRIYGLFKDPNVFGPFVVPAVALLCACWLGLPLAARIAGLTLVLLPVPASLSRGAALALLASLVVLGTVAGFRKWHKTAGYCVLLLALAAGAQLALLALPGSSIAEQRLTTGLMPHDADRFAGQLAGLIYLSAHPTLIGLGPGNYDAVVGEPSNETYVRMLVETGPLSIFALLALVVTAIGFIRSRDRATVAWVAALIGFLAYGFFIDILHWRHFWLVLAMPFAISAYEAARQRAAATEERPNGEIREAVVA
jgi:hypothetical protein